MRKVYSKPVIEVENYTLDQNIAGACSDAGGIVVNLGPGDYKNYVCDFFKDPDTGGGDFDEFSLRPGISTMSTGSSFYNGTNGPVCDCYYSSGGEGYFTS